jgi:hypothetical protein
MAAREGWSKSHPWIAGVYVGLLFWAVFPLLALIDSTISLGSAYLLGLVLLPVTAVLFAVGVKRRWGVREDAPRRATMRNPWRQATDRFLFWFQWLGIAGLVASIAGLFGEHPWGAAVGLLCACWIAATTWSERRHRRMAD